MTEDRRSNAAETGAATALLERLGLPRDRFAFQAIPPADGLDVFEIASDGPQAIVRGSSPVAQAAGLHWFLKYHCKSNVSWWGTRITLPQRFPQANERRTSPYRYRYYLNYVTYSYSAAFWDWERWEKEIDWMALHGINLPLSVLGQVAVWMDVYRELGVTGEELDAFFAGPAYQPFGWMGCLDGWGGPLTRHMVERQAELAARIVARQRELGMTPVLQGFTGHIPQALARRFPRARVYRQQWLEFEPTCVLDPEDPLFRQIGSLFIRKQAERYGTDHVYAADPFIEMVPPSSDPGFLAAWARAIYRGMAEADPQAVWLMQTWMFHFRQEFWGPEQIEAYLTAVPAERVIALDLYAEEVPLWQKTRAFHGRPWLWCMVHNFGGRPGLHGKLHVIGRAPAEALHHPGRGDLAGLGLTMEALEQNPVVYDLMTEMAWHTEPVDLDRWLQQYAERRYGTRTEAVDESWRILKEHVYTAGVSLPPRTVVCARPTFSELPHDRRRAKAVWHALDLMLQAASALQDAPGYRFDLVDLTRQALSDLIDLVHVKLVAAWSGGDAGAFDTYRTLLVELIHDLDAVLATHPAFLLGRWLEAAKAWGTNDAERAHMEWNARRLITLWGRHDGSLFDYSCRHWSGLVRSFYAERWRRFLDRAAAALRSGTPFDEEQVRNDIALWEDEWSKGSDLFPTEPAGDPIAVCRAMARRHRPLLHNVLQETVTEDE